jgi:mannitol/fructose-specific phosphotransferase system IIA component (Ntr-type)
MKLSTLLNPKLVKCGLKAQSKDEALRELVEVLVAHDPTLGAEEILQALAERERMGPFSMGKGAAFPHARTEKVKDFTIVVGTAPEGIDFKAPDGNKIRILVLFVIPKKHSNLYLHALAQFLSVFAAEGQAARVIAAKTGEEAVAVLDSASPKKEGSVRDTVGGPVLSVTSSTTLSRTIELMLQNRVDALPVVDAEGNLAGEVTAAAILQLGVRDHLLTLSNAMVLKTPEPFEGLLRTHGETALESLPGLVASNSFKTVQEDEPLLEVAVRLTRAGARTAYVLRGRRLTGTLTVTDLLRRIAGKG